jgi:hypothetical protein
LIAPRPVAFLPEKGTQMDGNTSTSARQRKPRPKPERRIRLCMKPEGAAPGVIRISIGKDAHDYFLTELPADFGRGFRLEKIGTDGEPIAYAVNIDGDKRTCECKGFGRWQRCKHVDGLAALLAAGLLPAKVVA